MQVILLDDVPGLGEAGDLVKVKAGYGRNYLIPQGLAQLATREGLNRVESIRRAGEERRRKSILEVKDRIAALEGKTLLVPMKVGGEARLFGAVTTLLLAEKIREQYQLEIDRRYIALQDPIKYLGTYEVLLKAGSAVAATIRVEVVNEAEASGEPAAADMRLRTRPDSAAALPPEMKEGAAYGGDAAEKAASAALAASQEDEAAAREDEASRIEEGLGGG